MAEVVFESLEAMLPELEELRNHEVFNEEEIRMVIKTRTDFEYKLQKRVVEKKDILNYLDYEMKFDRLRVIRAKKLKLKDYTIASLGISRRLHTLFRKALMKFGEDLSLWMQYIEFCKKTKSTRAVGLALGKLIQTHSHNPDVWVTAAKYEFEENKNVDNARSLLQRALRTHTDSKKLWHEYFRLELLHVNKIKQRRKALGVDAIELKNEDENTPEMMDDFLNNKTANIVYNNATQKITDDIGFCLDFVKICESFEETEELQEEIMKSIETLFPHCEQLCVERIRHFVHKFSLQTIHSIVKENDWIEFEENVQNKFQEAILRFNTSYMWESYVDAFVQLLNESTNSEQAKRRLATVLGVFDEAGDLASEKLYLLWSELLSSVGRTDKALVKLHSAVQKLNHSQQLWLAYLELKASQCDDWQALKCDFEEALKYVKESHVVWQMYIDAAECIDDREETSQIYESAIKSPARASILPRYIVWKHKTSGAKATRKFVKKLLKEKLSLDFLSKALELEQNSDDSPNTKYCYSIFEKMIEDYGKTSTDVWLDYILFARRAQDLDCASNLYIRAKRTLNDNLCSEFIEKYTLANMT